MGDVLAERAKSYLNPFQLKAVLGKSLLAVFHKLYSGSVICLSVFILYLKIAK